LQKSPTANLQGDTTTQTCAAVEMKGVEGGGSDEEFGFGFVKLNPFRGWKRGMEEVSSLLEEEVQRAGSGGV